MTPKTLETLGVKGPLLLGGDRVIIVPVCVLQVCYAIHAESQELPVGAGPVPQQHEPGSLLRPLRRRGGGQGQAESQPTANQSPEPTSSCRRLSLPSNQEAAFQPSSPARAGGDGGRGQT